MLGAFFAVGYVMSVIALSAVGLFGRQELVRSAIAARRRHRLRDSTISRSFRGPQTASHRHPDHLRRKHGRLGAALNLRSVPIGTTVSRGSALKPGPAVRLREVSADVPACAPRPLRNYAQRGGTEAVFEAETRITNIANLPAQAPRLAAPPSQVLWPTKSASSFRVVSCATNRNIGAIRKNDTARSGSAAAIECDVAIQPTIAGARAPPALPKVKAAPTAVPRICVGNSSVL